MANKEKHMFRDAEKGSFEFFAKVEIAWKKGRQEVLREIKEKNNENAPAKPKGTNTKWTKRAIAAIWIGLLGILFAARFCNRTTNSLPAQNTGKEKPVCDSAAKCPDRINNGEPKEWNIEGIDNTNEP